MYQIIHEPIDVIGVFSSHKFVPRKFRWGQRELPISEITFVSDLKDGGVRSRQYSVLAEGNLYRLLFNRDSEGWWLEEIWHE